MIPLNYIELVGEFFPDAKAHCIGDVSVYTNIQWSTDPIPQDQLDVLHLAKVKTLKILEFSELAHDEIVEGVTSDALGYKHLYDSTEEDQLNLIGAVTAQTTMYYGCRPYIEGKQLIDMGGTVVGTNATGLANNTTIYTAEIVIDGTSAYVSIIGNEAQTFDALLAQINSDLVLNTTGHIAIVNGNIEVHSGSHNVTSSTVNVIDVGLFSSLVGYVGINEATVGTDGSEAVTKEYIEHTHAQLLQVLNDGKDIKLMIMQKYNVKRAQVLNCNTPTEVENIVW